MPPQETKLNANMTVDTTPQQLADFTAKFKALSANPTYPTAINSSVMSSTPVKIPDTTYQPTTGNLSTAVNTTQANATAVGSAAPVTDEKSQLNSYLKGIIDNTGKQASEVAKIQQDEDRAKKKERALQLENEITAMDKAYRDEVASIKENRQGKLESGIQDEVNRATDRYQNNRANASIAYNTALGAYNVANDIVNQKVQALKDQNTQAMNAYSLLKDTIYNDLTESEKLQVQANLNKQKSQANLIESAYTSALSSAAKNGAPASVLAAIDTASKAPNATAASIYAAAGGYITDKTSGNEAPKVTKVNGVDAVWDGEKFVPITVGGAVSDTLRLAQTQGNIQNIDDVLNNPALTSSVGTSFLSRIRGKGLYKLTGDTQNFLAGVQQITSQLSLDSLINAKERGATFGALSEGELKLLSDSATKIDKWAKKDENGNYTAISTSEKAFKEELDKIKNYAKIDYILRGGKPEDVGVALMEDGALITKNSDGTPIQLN